MGVLADYMPRKHCKSENVSEQVFCIKFEDNDFIGTFLHINFLDSKLGNDYNYSFLISIVTCKGIYVWGISVCMSLSCIS